MKLEPRNEPQRAKQIPKVKQFLRFYEVYSLKSIKENYNI